MLGRDELSEEEEEEQEEIPSFITVSAAQLDNMQRQIPGLQEHPPATKLHQRQDSPALMGRSSFKDQSEAHVLV